MTRKSIVDHFNDLSVSTKVLILEAMCSVVGNVLIHSHGWYFIGLCVIPVFGVWTCSKSLEPTAQAIEQMYMWDFVIHVIGLAIYFSLSGDPLVWGQFAYKSALATLTTLKILAVVTSGAIPGQTGWPNIFPFVRNRRVIEPSRAHDLAMYGVCCAAVAFGVISVVSGKSLDWEVWGVPVVLAVLAERTRARSIQEHSLNAEALTFAGIFQACTPEMREAVKKGLLRAAQKNNQKSE